MDSPVLTFNHQPSVFSGQGQQSIFIARHTQSISRAKSKPANAMTPWQPASSVHGYFNLLLLIEDL